MWHEERADWMGSGKGGRPGAMDAGVRGDTKELARRGACHQPSVASPIICRSALAIEAHRGVASLANTARYGLRDAPCAALR